MTATLTLTVNDQEVRDTLARAAAALGDLTPLMNEIADGLLFVAQGRFETSRGPGGVEWPQSRAARERGGKTLVASRHLQDSLTRQFDANSAEVGTNETYAAIHQFGGTIKPVTAKALRFQLPNGAVVFAAQVTLPARPYLGFDSDDEEQIIDITEAHLARVFGS